MNLPILSAKIPLNKIAGNAASEGKSIIGRIRSTAPLAPKDSFDAFVNHYPVANKNSHAHASIMGSDYESC